MEVKFVDVAACQQFLESYSSGAVRQSLSQHACRLLALSQEFTVETQLKASTHILDLYLDKLELCLQHIHLSQVFCLFHFIHSASHCAHVIGHLVRRGGCSLIGLLILQLMETAVNGHNWYEY